MQIFLSYRRADVGGYAGRIADVLRQRLGPRGVFQDVVAIAPGEDFMVRTDRALDESDAVLAIIGPGWLAPTTASGKPRLFDADDYVRLELQRALERDARVIPVLVGGAPLPAPGELPEDIRKISQRQAVVLHDESWHEDIDSLVRSLRGDAAGPRRSVSRWVVVGALTIAFLALLTTGVVIWLTSTASTPTGPGASSPASIESPPSTEGESHKIGDCAPPSGAGWSRLTLSDKPTGRTRVETGTLTFTVRSAKWRPGPSGWQVILSTTMKNETGGPVYHGEWLYEYLNVAQRRFDPTCYSPHPVLVDQGTIGDALIGFDVRCKPAGYIQLVLDSHKATISVTEEALEPAGC
jgi:hypothetical protein